MEEVKSDIGWRIDTRCLLISLPDHKYKAWDRTITEILEKQETNESDLDTLIGRLTHITMILPTLLNFLSRIRSLHFVSKKRRSVKIYENHESELKLARVFLHKANVGIDMNLISFRKPTHVYRADACPWGLGGYNQFGRAWRFEIPQHLLFRATLNMLEFLASCIGPWIDILENNLPPQSCTLSETDSTTTAGWLRKSNFKDDDKTQTHEHCKLSLARDHALRLLTNNVKEYSQWFPGVENEVADSLSRDFHLDDKSLTSLLHLKLKSQILSNLIISPLPPEIVSWICSWLQRMPRSPLSQEQQTKSKISHGVVGKNFSHPLNSMMMTSLKNSTKISKLDCSVHLLSQLEMVNIQERLSIPWLLQQSTIPWTMWLRPSGTISTPTRSSMILANLHAFYRSSTRAIKTLISQLNSKKPSLSASSRN